VPDVGMRGLTVVADLAAAVACAFDFDVELDLSRCIRRISA